MWPCAVANCCHDVIMSVLYSRPLSPCARTCPRKRRCRRAGCLPGSSQTCRHRRGRRRRRCPWTSCCGCGCGSGCAGLKPGRVGQGKAGSGGCQGMCERARRAAERGSPGVSGGHECWRLACLHAVPERGWCPARRRPLCFAPGRWSQLAWLLHPPAPGAAAAVPAANTPSVLHPRQLLVIESHARWHHPV